MSIDVISQGIRMISKENRKRYMVTCATVGAHEQGVNLSKKPGYLNDYLVGVHDIARGGA